jgi:hypothetical protein
VADVRQEVRQEDGEDRDGVVDLLGLLAYAELVAFFRLAEDAALASSLADKAALAAMAVAEFSHFGRLRDQLDQIGADPDRAMRPFVAAVDAFHARTAPSDWLEGLVKAYVGDGMAVDFYRVIADALAPEPRALVLDVLADTGHAAFAVDRVRAAIVADPKVAGRLALWARRLVGEALGQAQRVAAEREPLARLLTEGSRLGAKIDGEKSGQLNDAPGNQAENTENAQSQLGDMGRMFARLTDEHSKRMAALGLSS